MSHDIDNEIQDGDAMTAAETMTAMNDAQCDDNHFYQREMVCTQGQAGNKENKKLFYS